MPGQTILCYGCDEETEEDHYHQYINSFNETKSCWYIDGMTFVTPSDAAIYLEETLECTTDEAFEFLRTLPKKDT